MVKVWPASASRISSRNYSAETYATPGREYMHHGQFGADLPARDANGKLLWGVEPGPLGEIGAADDESRHTAIASSRPSASDLKLPWPKPDHYDPEHYELLLRYIHAHPGISFARLVHLDAIPNGKFDLNASGPFSIDFVGGNYGYPEATYAERDRMLQAHQDYEKGFLWFLAHDSACTRGSPQRSQQLGHSRATSGPTATTGPRKSTFAKAAG